MNIKQLTLIFAVTFFFVGNVIANDCDNCDLEIIEKNVVKTVKKDVVKAVKKYKQTGNKANLMTKALRTHNQVRALVRQKPLKVSKDLIAVSQTWAKQLAQTCKLYHHKAKDFPAGENLFYSSKAISITESINSWAAEKKNYDYTKNFCPKGMQCYHYTQMVWKGTTELGCAIEKCANDSGAEIHVCTYFPRGNIIGARPY